MSDPEVKTMTVSAATAESPSKPYELAPDTIPEILISDRCDRCGARSYVATMIPHADGVTRLDWCAHHYRQHADKLEAVATAVRNEEHKINLKPMSGTPDG